MYIGNSVSYYFVNFTVGLELPIKLMHIKRRFKESTPNLTTILVRGRVFTNLYLQVK
jgi:hypothetical protein